MKTTRIKTKAGNVTTYADTKIKLAGSAKVAAQVVTTKTTSKVMISGANAKRLIRNNKKLTKEQRKQALDKVDSQSEREKRVVAADKVTQFASDKAYDAVTTVSVLKNGTKKYQAVYYVA